MYKRIFCAAVCACLTFTSLSGCRQSSFASGSSSLSQNEYSENSEAASDSQISETDSVSASSITDSDSQNSISQNITSKAPTTGKKEEKITDKRKPSNADTTEKLPISSLTLKLFSYSSANEPKPFVKSEPIYQVLYSGSRAQINDTLEFLLEIFPADYSGKIQVDASDNLDYSLSGNKLTVKVKSNGNYSAGNITVYGLSDENKIQASKKLSFVIDASGNPFDNIAAVFGDYIRLKGMEYCFVENGYTKSDPSLSITKYKDAPSWDDCIYKSNADWIKQSFDLLDEYAGRSFKKVNFIVTNQSVGFCACK